MFKKFFEFIKLWLPYGLVLWLYAGQKGLPANIRLKSGRNLRAVMITTEYGVIYTKEKYNAERLAVLKREAEITARKYDIISKEINNLGFEAREEMFNGEVVADDSNQTVREK